MSYTVEYAYPRGTVVYVRALALEGRLTGGPVSRISISIGISGLGDRPVKEYAVENPLIFPPPGGLFDESELCTETEAKAIVRTWADRQANRYERIRDQT